MASGITGAFTSMLNYVSGSNNGTKNVPLQDQRHLDKQVLTQTISCVTCSGSKGCCETTQKALAKLSDEDLSKTLKSATIKKLRDVTTGKNLPTFHTAAEKEAFNIELKQAIMKDLEDTFGSLKGDNLVRLINEDPKLKAEVVKHLDKFTELLPTDTFKELVAVRQDIQPNFKEFSERFFTSFKKLK